MSTADSSLMPYMDPVALPPGVSQVDFEAALVAGRERGHLTQAELIEALHSVELTAEVLNVLMDRVAAEGLSLVDDDGTGRAT